MVKTRVEKPAQEEEKKPLNPRVFEPKAPQVRITRGAKRKPLEDGDKSTLDDHKV